MTVSTIEILISSLLNEACNIHTHSTLMKTKEDKKAVLIAMKDDRESRKKSKNRKQNVDYERDPDGKCFTCNRDIHSENNYYNIYLKKHLFFQQNSSVSNTGDFNDDISWLTSSNHSDNNKQHHKMFVFFTDYTVLNITAMKEQLQEWVVDIKVTHHLCWNRSIFVNYINLRTRTISENFSSAVVIRIDSVSLQCLLCNRSISDIILKNVLYVSVIIYNLLSINVAQKASTHF